MGSRGAFIKTGGFTEYNYSTVIRYNNVRYIVQNDRDRNLKLPERSNSKWAVYAVISNKGNVQYLNFYDGKRRLYKEIDLAHSHQGLKPHVHDVDVMRLSLRTNEARGLKKKELSKLNKVLSFYEKHKISSKLNKDV